ncbi:metallophosphoesterase family protein [Candidatus Thioglobus sp.]|uniref:metallophosphoesterase family protein n=1 Tax=Candidatus Thioglobus sp. TaxID=2026721 RepID=UPI003242C167
MPKLCILSDSHGVIHPEVVKIANQCDIAIHAGDIINENTLSQLKPKQKLIAIKGNNDDHITSLNSIEFLEFPSGKIAIEHGHLHGHHKPSHESLRLAYADAKVVIYGHTHKQVIDKESTPWVINPGASGEIRNHGGAKCLVLEVNDDQEWIVTPYVFN